MPCKVFLKHYHAVSVFANVNWKGYTCRPITSTCVVRTIVICLFLLLLLVKLLVLADVWTLQATNVVSLGVHTGRVCPVRWPDSKYRHCQPENLSLLKQVRMAYHQTLAPPTDEWLWNRGQRAILCHAHELGAIMYCNRPCKFCFILNNTLIHNSKTI